MTKQAYVQGLSSEKGEPLNILFQLFLEEGTGDRLSEDLCRIPHDVLDVHLQSRGWVSVCWPLMGMEIMQHVCDILLND